MQACKPFAYIIKCKALSLGHKTVLVFLMLQKIKNGHLCAGFLAKLVYRNAPIYNAMVEMPLTPSGLDSLLGLSGL